MSCCLDLPVGLLSLHVCFTRSCHFVPAQAHCRPQGLDVFFPAPPEPISKTGSAVHLHSLHQWREAQHQASQPGLGPSERSLQSAAAWRLRLRLLYFCNSPNRPEDGALDPEAKGRRELRPTRAPGNHNPCATPPSVIVAADTCLVGHILHLAITFGFSWILTQPGTV